VAEFTPGDLGREIEVPTRMGRPSSKASPIRRGPGQFAGLMQLDLSRFDRSPDDRLRNRIARSIMKPSANPSVVRVLPLLLLAAAAILLTAVALGVTCADIDKFYWIDHRIATGGQPKPGEIASLKREGFRTIINLREPSEYDADAEAAEARGLGLRYISIPVPNLEPKDEQVDTFLATLKDKKVWPAFAHCRSGNRVAAFWMIHRVLVDGWEIEPAEQEARLVGLKSANMREFAYEYICRHQKAEPRSVPCANRKGGTD
jgi:uncharacterized protein (TIGR01244 family)